MTGPVFITAEIVARELSISKRSAYELIRRLPHIRIGRSIRISRTAFETWRREEECRAISGAESDGTGRLGGFTGPTSAGAEFRRGALRSAPRESGKQLASESEPIHVSQPRKRRPSAAP